MFDLPRLQYVERFIDVLFAQRDFNTARMDLIDTKREQLSAVVNAYQALGGGWRNVGGQILMPPIGPAPPGAQLPASRRYSPGIGPNSVNFVPLEGEQAGLLAVPLKAVVCCRGRPSKV